MCPLMGTQLSCLYFYCYHEKGSIPHNLLCSFYGWDDAFSGPDTIVGYSRSPHTWPLVTAIGGYTSMPRSSISGLFPRLPGPGVETRPIVPDVLSSFSPADISWPIPSYHRWSKRGSLEYHSFLPPRGPLGIYADLLTSSPAKHTTGYGKLHILYLPN